MKRATKDLKIVGLLVLLTIVFLLSFNAVYSYFTTVRGVGGDLDFYNLDVKFTYTETNGSQTLTVQNQKQLFPSSAFSRNVAVGLKASAGASAPVYDLGIKSTSDSCGAYVRFYLEVYMTKSFSNGVNCYIDSNGNYVSEDGKYYNSVGAEIAASEVTPGDIVDYAEYFELGRLNGNAYTYNTNVTRQVKTVNDQNYVAYFYNSKLNRNESIYLRINAIKMLSTAPNELLDSDVVVFVTLEGVQATNGAYKSVFNDNYGYYNWES